MKFAFAASVAIAMAAVVVGGRALYTYATDPDTHPACRLQMCTLLPGRTNNGQQLGMCADGTTRSLIGAPRVDAPLAVTASPCALYSGDPMGAARAAYTFADGGADGALPRHHGLRPARSRAAPWVCACASVALMCALGLARATKRGATPAAAVAGAFCGLTAGWWIANLPGGRVVSCEPGVCAPDMCKLSGAGDPQRDGWRSARCDVFGEAWVYVWAPAEDSGAYHRASRCMLADGRGLPAPPDHARPATMLYQMHPDVHLGPENVPQACVYAQA